MNQQEITALIRAGVPKSNGVWADIGAGTGNFTQTLRGLLGEKATIYAVDRNQQALNQLKAKVATPLQAIVGDFTRPLDLPKLDGLLMANALHWVGKQESVMRRLIKHLKPDGRFILVEYDVSVPRPYIPSPVSYHRFQKLAESIGLGDIQKIGERVSPSSGISMYAGMGVYKR